MREQPNRAFLGYWFEELDQHGPIDDVRSVLNSLRRGGDRFWVFFSFNPPKTALSWANRETLERRQREDTLVCRSSYLDVVGSHPEWLGGPFIEEAEWLREANELAWRWGFLGEVVGTGGNVFSNVVEREVSDEEIRSFERIKNGLDWGWWPDPWRRLTEKGWSPIVLGFSDALAIMWSCADVSVMHDASDPPPTARSGRKFLIWLPREWIVDSESPLRLHSATHESRRS